jgi:hypothetical protein
VASLEAHIAREESKAASMSLPDRLARLEVQQKYTYDAVNNILLELRAQK